MPKVTVILSVFNCQRWVKSAVRSILTQTFTDFELICVNDGSTDGSLQILEQLAKEDARVRIITQPNGGVAVAGNSGLQHARGKYIARLDSDDIALPDRLQKQVAFMDAHPEVVLLGTAYELIDDADRLLTTHHQPTTDRELQALCLSGLIPIAHTSCMYRREDAARVGNYDTYFQSAEDLDLYLRLGEVGKMACLPEVLARYRQHSSSLSESKQQLQIDRMRDACERAWARRGLTQVEFKAKAWRATGDRTSRFEQFIRFGWWAYQSGTRDGAIHYGWQSVWLFPWKLEAWKLLFCGLLKTPTR